MVASQHWLTLQPWEQAFYRGDRLSAELIVHAQRLLRGPAAAPDALAACRVLQASHGRRVQPGEATAFARFQALQPEPSTPAQCREQYLAAADAPDALLFWLLHRRLARATSSEERVTLLRRLALLLYAQLSARPDLIYLLVGQESSGVLLKSAPRTVLKPGQWYSRPEAFLPMLQIAWVQGRYQDMWRGCLLAQIDGRYFPLSDHHIRGLSIIGEQDRCLELFTALYERTPQEFQIGSISNMLFMALGSQQLPQPLIEQLVSHFHTLAERALPFDPASPSPTPTPTPQPLQVSERPLLVVASSDLRNHPVGRFWLPIARQLRRRFRVIAVAGHPRDQDPIRAELRQHCDDWWPLESAEVPAVAARIRAQSPALLIDLGGHTADNHPLLLSHRLARVQATYLGFYGPSYARCCDWWIIDQPLQRWIGASYPGSEPLWPLPGPSLCYQADLHHLPPIDTIRYQEPNHPVYGSFNHTRKLTRTTQERFGAVLAANPDAVLQFRSHSFHDPAVRRHFLQRFQDMGMAPHQLQPLPYAPSFADAMADYGRIHLHLDSVPVSGTTTTLDSLAMGIPVLTCPTPYYAGAISAAILDHAGLADHICPDPAQLPAHARWLAQRYRSAAARRALARQVRQSPVCDAEAMPAMFSEQLALMLRQAQAA